VFQLESRTLTLQSRTLTLTLIGGCISAGVPHNVRRGEAVTGGDHCPFHLSVLSPGKLVFVPETFHAYACAYAAG
jgi:hypothetical protein